MTHFKKLKEKIINMIKNFGWIFLVFGQELFEIYLTFEKFLFFERNFFWMKMCFFWGINLRFKSLKVRMIKFWNKLRNS